MREPVTWIVLVSGFSQGIHRENGFSEIYQELRPLVGPRTWVELRPWNTNMVDYAGYISRQIAGMPYRIVISGYSYGGYGGSWLSRELSRLGYLVDSLVLVDPVWRILRSFWRGLPGVRFVFKPLPSILSLLPFWRIRVPRNVRDVIWFHQRETLPFGHKVVLDNPVETNLAGPLRLVCPHTEAEDDSLVREVILEVSRTAALGFFA